VEETGLTYSVSLAHSTDMDLGTNFASNLQSDALQVYNDTFDIPAMLTGDWFGFDLSTPFSYDGNSNLVMEIRGTGGTHGVFACRRNMSMSNAQLLWEIDEAATDGTLFNILIDTRFHITQ